jgi:hypothetical protein
MNKIALVLLAVFCSLPPVFAREPDLDNAEAWVGTWKRTDGGQTLTISFAHDSTRCTISYSKGTPDSGKMVGNGDTIEFEGSTKGGYEHSQGTLTLTAGNTKIIKRQTIFAQDGPEKHLSATYVRTANNRGLPSTEEMQSDSAGDGDVYSYFRGTYQADDNPDSTITIKVHGNKATIRYSLGGETRSGTIHEGGEIQYRVSSTQRGTMVRSESGGIDVRVVSSNGHVETERYTRIR